jgi:hypothetical protein
VENVSCGADETVSTGVASASSKDGGVQLMVNSSNPNSKNTTANFGHSVRFVGVMVLPSTV